MKPLTPKQIDIITIIGIGMAAIGIAGVVYVLSIIIKALNQ